MVKGLTVSSMVKAIFWYILVSLREEIFKVQIKFNSRNKILTITA